MLAWNGATVALLASGASLSVEQCERVRAWRDARPDLRKAIAINTTFRRAPWADVLYACDWAWWQVYVDEVRASFAGALWTQDDFAAKQYRLNFIGSENAPGLSRTPGVIYQGANSGYQAIGLAHQAGVKRIVLLGYDMRGGHWHGDHPARLNRAQNFNTWLANFRNLAVDLVDAGVVVVNASTSTETVLRCFPQVELEDALREEEACSLS
jgi:hypothetical protein